MRNIRYASLFLVVGLIIAFIAFSQVFVVSSNSDNSQRSSVGMGDLRFAESQQGIIPVTGMQSNSRAKSGMGDLRLLEASQGNLIGSLNDDYAGMGDLRLFDASR